MISVESAVITSMTTERSVIFVPIRKVKTMGL